jgi:GNAT superfamily N-acetyltransferase
LILGFIRALAEYEKLPHEVVAGEAMLRQHLFGERPVAEVILSEWDGEAVGFALFFTSFSTFVGRPGLYLEDLFVREEMRGRGIGRALLVELARIAVERNYGRMEWSVLDWNTPSIEFYKKLGAQPKDEWTVYRVAGEALQKLAAG